MIVNGKAIAADIYAQLKERRAHIDRPIKLGILVASKDPVIEMFVRIKTRQAAALDVEMVRVDLASDTTQGVASRAVEDLCATVDGIIVQLPFPHHIDIDAVLSCIPENRDVEAMNPQTPKDMSRVEVPVAGAIREILIRYEIHPHDMRAVVVGAGRLVGAPAARLLGELGARVSIVTLEDGSLEELHDADIAVLGAGNPGFVTPDMIKAGIVLIDAGTSEAGGKIRGDADPACAEKAAIFTPVPGGVGPIAVAMIFKNLFDLVEID